MLILLCLESLLVLLCLGSMLMMFQKAYRLKTDDKYKNSIINQESNEINEKGELYTGFRKYKSVDGYIKYQYGSLIAWGIFAILFIIISVTEYILRTHLKLKFIVFLITMIVTDYIIYRRNKNI